MLISGEIMEGALLAERLRRRGTLLTYSGAPQISISPPEPVLRCLASLRNPVLEMLKAEVLILLINRKTPNFLRISGTYLAN